jgi:quercetin dioxygenase-like cupin family protein
MAVFSERRGLLVTYKLLLSLLALSAVAISAARAQELLDPLAAGWNGKPVCERLHEDDQLRVVRCSFPPGVGHERHYHPRHFGYVLTGGTMRITDSSGPRDVEVRTGSSFSSSGIPWHEALNIGDTTATYLIIEPK